jgi:hypothetical protein
MMPLRRLADEALPGGGRKVVFEAEWREGFVGRALTIELDAGSTIATMEFYDADAGITRWVSGQGLGSTRAWESDPDDDSLSKHFTATLLGAERRGGRLPHVEELEDGAWQEVVRDALRNPAKPIVVPDACLFLRRARRNTDEIEPAERGFLAWWRRLIG